MRPSPASRRGLACLLCPASLVLLAPGTAQASDPVPAAGVKAAEQGTARPKPADPAAQPKPADPAARPKPVDPAARPKPEDAPKANDGAAAEPGGHARGYQTEVVARAADADRVGAYRQPVWTTKRQFTTTRVYVRPQGEAEIEYWLTTKGDLKKGTGPSFESQLEFSYGLGKRFQLDLYLTMKQDHYDTALRLAAEKLELRYAFADWGKIPGNPTVYLEWVRQHEGPMKLEGKLLFAGELSRKVFWGLNLVYESELGREYEGEWAVTYGLAAVLKRRLVLLGFEAKLQGAHVQDGRTPRFADLAFQVGPSLALKPGRFHILLVPMLGVKYVRGLAPGERDETKGVYTILAIAGVEL